MKALSALNTLGDLCSSQQGMFTTAQAMKLGVGRMTISRLANNGQIIQLLRGVYRVSAAPSFREEDVFATWLSLEPETESFNRSRDTADFVACSNTAAWLHEIGELTPEPFAFSHPKRYQTRKGYRITNRKLSEKDVAIVAGIPTTTLKRTFLDLLKDGEDLSLVASALNDAERKEFLENIEAEINQHSESYGFDKGFDLYSYLKELA